MLTTKKNGRINENVNVVHEYIKPAIKTGLVSSSKPPSVLGLSGPCFDP